MKTQRRFTKRFEIEAEINKLKRRAKSKIAEACDFEKIVEAHKRDANLARLTEGERQFHIDQADFNRKKAYRLRRTAEIINDVKLPMFGRTLAAFQTETLFPNDDQAVVLQR